MTSVVVQSDQIIKNIQALQKAVEKKNLIPVLEGNAFGLGDVKVAQLIYDAGIRMVAVSRIEEAERLADALPRMSILLMTPYSTAEDAARIVQAGVIAAVDSADNALLISGVARNMRSQMRVHIKFDVGSSGSGFSPGDVSTVAQVIRNCENLDVCGAFSEYSKADGFGYKKKLAEQYELFNKAVKSLSAEGFDCECVHIADTKSALRFPEFSMNTVRCGSGVVGQINFRDRWGIKPASKVVASIAEVRWSSSGHFVSRESRKRTKKPMKLAIVPVGTADGLFLRPSDEKRRIWKFLWKLLRRDKPSAEIRGKKARLAGRAGYTSIAIDVTDIECSPGETVTIRTDTRYVNPMIRREYV